MKSAKITCFVNKTHYQMNGGVNHLKWDVEYAYFTLLVSKRFINFFLKKSELKIVSNIKGTYFLIVFGLFSIDCKKLIVNEADTISKSIRIGKVQNSKIKVAEISKPKKMNNSIAWSFSNAKIKSNQVKIKSIHP
jgi:23S rRNA A1618 N6-methylase RlmF